MRAVVVECLDKDPSRRQTARDLLLRLVDPSAQRAQAAPAYPASQAFPTAQAYPVDSVPGTGPVPPLAEPTPAGGMPPQFPVPQRASPRSRRGPVRADAPVPVALLIAVAFVLLTRGS